MGIYALQELLLMRDRPYSRAAETTRRMNPSHAAQQCIAPVPVQLWKILKVALLVGFPKNQNEKRRIAKLHSAVRLFFYAI